MNGGVVGGTAGLVCSEVDEYREEGMLRSAPRLKIIHGIFQRVRI